MADYASLIRPTSLDTLIVRFLDHQDETNPLNGFVIVDDAQLSQVLDSFRTREPFFAELYCENGYKLLIGIGRTVGCVQYGRSDGDKPYLMAVTCSGVKLTELCGEAVSQATSRRPT